jgi:catalase
MSLGDKNTNEFSVSDAGTQETTQFGAKIDNTDSLTVGPHGPTLLEDFMLREKIMHFGKQSKSTLINVTNRSLFFSLLN